MAKKSLPAQLTKRTPLQDLIPLDTPYSVLLSPIDHCNIKCVFCPFHGAVKSDDRQPGIMSLELYKTIIDQLAEFPNKIRTLVFCGRGEPTLHKDLPEMIRYAKNKNIAGAIRMTTNGFNLSPELNQQLIDAGLDYIKISVPAIDEQTCFEITGVRLNLQDYINNIRHLYENKHDNMTVFCKATNVALGGKNGAEIASDLEDKFYSAFDSVCDYCFVENIVPQTPRKLSSSELNQMWIGNQEVKNVYALSDNSGSPVCERLFYHFTINSMGNVYPCDLNESLFLGNIQNTTLPEIWNGDILQSLRIAFLKGEIPSCCSDCLVSMYDFPNELHKYADEICYRLIKGKPNVE